MNWQQACELPYYGGNDLGANWTRAQTVFKLWAPTASAVEVQLFATGTDGEPGAAALAVHAMQPAGQGVWSAAVPGDLQGVYYLYALQFPDGHQAVVVDPYARAAGANGQRGMVLDLDAAAPEGWQADARPQIPAHARAVWEVHVADFSADEHSGVPEAWRGTYLGFVPEDTTLDGDGRHPTCLNYLKGLGVSHVQLQPIFDYATVDETKPGGYNWGYDPLNYNVPEGSFSTRPVPRGGPRAGMPRHDRGAAPRRAGRGDGRGLQPHLPHRQLAGTHGARLLEPALARRPDHQRFGLWQRPGQRAAHGAQIPGGFGAVLGAGIPHRRLPLRPDGAGRCGNDERHPRCAG